MKKGNGMEKDLVIFMNLIFHINQMSIFPVKGTYQFKIQHGMRIEDLKGVYDFGLRIEKISK